MKKGLGRGLGSLFANYEDYDIEEKVEIKKEPKSEVKEEDNKDKVLQVDVGLIDRNENQPRKNFDEKAFGCLKLIQTKKT